MRKKMRRHLAIIMFVSITGLLPLLHLRNTTESRIAMADSIDFRQVVKLDEQSDGNLSWSHDKDEKTKEYANNAVLETNAESETPKSDSMETNSSNTESSTSREDSRPSDGHIVIETPEIVSKEQDDSSTSPSLTSSDNVSEIKYIDTLEEDEYWCLAIIATKEAGSASPEIQRAVISTILNRVKCHAFPDTIYDVVMQKGQFFNGWPKFTDSNGVYREITRDDVPDSIKESIHAVITEGDFSNGAYFYITPRYLSQSKIDKFHRLYGEPCLAFEGGKGEFFTKDYGEG